MFGHGKKVIGTAKTVGYTMIGTSAVQNGAVHDVLDVQAVVTAEGVPPTAVRFRATVSQAVMPLPEGYEFRVKLDPSDPTQVRVVDEHRRELDTIRARRLAAVGDGMAEAERAAEQMRGEPSDDWPFG